MSSGIQPAELGFFVAIARSGSLSGAARELGISTAAVSKRLAQLEARLGIALINRTTRRMNLTPEGEVLYEHARRILGDIDDLDQLLSKSKGTPRGLLRVNATLGFGRIHVAPVVGRYAAMHPDVDVQLQLSAHPPPISEDSFDVCVQFGATPDGRVIARRLAPNRRLLCASPKYIATHGMPKTPGELAGHDCIGIRQGDDAYGVWRLTTGRGTKERTESIKVRGNLTTNDGEIAVSWALEGRGIVMRAEWDVQRYLASGRLVAVLPQYRTPEADIYAVYAHRHQLSLRVRSFVDFLSAAFTKFEGGER
jgi:DNA-binding transcriptional LysR family regulator